MENGLYRHYKGGLYRLLRYATNEADATLVVVYQSEKDGSVWVRDRKVFEDTVDGKPRFEFVGDGRHSDNDE